MNKTLTIYEFTLSAPYPDENGVAMQGTAYRIESFKGEARADDLKEAVGYILRHEKIADVFKHNKLDIESIIENVNPKETSYNTIVFLEQGLTFAFTLKEKQNE